MFNHNLWVEKYRPKSIKDFIFQDEEQKSNIQKMIAKGEIGHLLLSGIQGTGKSTLSGILINELNIDPSDVLRINGSDENSVDVMRTKISNFVKSIPMGPFLVVQLEEFDYLSPGAQAILRSVMEDYSATCKFICTCNYANKIMPALKSRMYSFEFKAPIVDDVTAYAAEILFNEDIDFDIDVLDTYINAYYPDVRKIINSIQQNTSENNKLNPPTGKDQSDWKYKIIDLISVDDWNGIRSLIQSDVPGNEIELVYRYLYEHIHESKKFNTDQLRDQAIVLIASYLYKHSLVADTEINIVALFIELTLI